MPEEEPDPEEEAERLELPDADEMPEDGVLPPLAELTDEELVVPELLAPLPLPLPEPADELGVTDPPELLVGMNELEDPEADDEDEEEEVGLPMVMHS